MNELSFMFSDDAMKFKQTALDKGCSTRAMQAHTCKPQCILVCSQRISSNPFSAEMWGYGLHQYFRAAATK